MLIERNLQQPVCKSVSTKLAQQEHDKINNLVADGLFLNYKQLQTIKFSILQS